IGFAIAGSNYGPYVFLTQIPVLLWYPAIAASKLVGVGFGLGGLLLLYLAVALLQRCWRVGILREFGAKGFRFSCWEWIMPFKLHSKGRRHIPRQRHRVTNWREYDASLRNRGSLTIWFTPEAIAGWKAQPRTTPGGQRHYSDLAIETALTLRTV